MSNSATFLPLAVDESGKPIPIPPDADFWGLRRHTAGRPHHVLGVDRKPLRLPLDYTPEELMRLVGRGTYRLDLYNAAGEHLETVALSLGEAEAEPQLRNQAAADEPTPAVASPALPTTSSEVRLVLEAQVRATQMAFQHNERTLTASLKMAETLRDGVQVLAQSQAEWIKAMAGAKGIFRNVAPIVMPPAAPTVSPGTASHDALGDGEDESMSDYEDEEEPVSATAHALGLSTEVMKFVNGVAGFGPSGKPVKLGQIANQLGLGAMLDWRKAAAQPPQAGEATAASAPPAAQLSPVEVLQVYGTLPAEVRTKLDEVRSKLTAREQQQLLATFCQYSAERLHEVANELAGGGTVDEIVADIRAVIQHHTKAA